VAPSCPTALIRRLLVLLFQVNLCVSLSLVASGKLASAELAGEGFLARVRADVRGQVVAPTKGAHAYPALEGFVACVDAEVARELVGAREAPVAVLRRTGVGPFVDRGFARPVGVLPRPDGFEGESLWRRVVLRRVLLPADETRVDLLLVFECPDGLQRCDGWRVDSDGVHGLEGLVLHHSNLPLMVEQVVVGDHGEKAAIHGGFGCGVIVIAGVGESRAVGGAVVEGDLVLIQVAARGIGGQRRPVHLLHV